MNDEEKLFKLKALLDELRELEGRRASKLPFFSFWTEDFQFGTRSFTAEERGMYVALLCSQWQQGSVPIDTQELADIAGVSRKKFEKLWPKRLQRKFIKFDDRWYNFRGVTTKIAALKRTKSH